MTVQIIAIDVSKSNMSSIEILQWLEDSALGDPVICEFEVSILTNTASNRFCVIGRVPERQ